MPQVRAVFFGANLGIEFKIHQVIGPLERYYALPLLAGGPGNLDLVNFGCPRQAQLVWDETLPGPPRTLAILRRGVLLCPPMQWKHGVDGQRPWFAVGVMAEAAPSP